MQRIFLLLALLLPAPCFAQLLVDPNPNATSYMLLAGQPSRAITTVLTDEENRKFKQVYDAVLHNDAALDAEGDALAAQLNAYQSKLKALMYKNDPKLQSILESNSHGPLTEDQSHEIRQTQSDVMQADPKLQSEWDDLAKKQTAHMQAVDAAMVKLDPTVASVLAKFSP